MYLQSFTILYLYVYSELPESTMHKANILMTNNIFLLMKAFHGMLLDEMREIYSKLNGRVLLL